MIHTLPKLQWSKQSGLLNEKGGKLNMFVLYCACLLITLVLTTSSVNASLPSHPHIILIVADDLGWGDVSFHGSSEILTPNIDALASESIVLDQYYVSPICSPSRSALLSGLHPIHTGMQHDVIMAGEPWGLPLNLTILPQYLKKLGYSNHAVGKWHMGFLKKEYTPIYRGFDSHFGYWGGHIDYYDHTGQVVAQGMDFHEDLQLVAPKYFGQYATTLFNNKALDVISNHNSSKPLFLYLCHLAVHAGNSYSTIQSPSSYSNRFPHIRNVKRKMFAGMVAALDDSLGDVIKALDAKGMLNDSIIIFTTDNGAAAGGIDGSIGSNWPLRGSKYTLWEGGVRGTAMIWSPLLKQQPKVFRQLMHISDWLPTIYHAAGGDPGELRGIDGIDMWDSLSRDLPSKRKEVLHNIDPVVGASAIRVGNFKLINGTIFDGAYDGWYCPPSYTFNNNQIYTINISTTMTAKILKYYHSHQNKKVSSTFPSFTERLDCGYKPSNASINCKPTEKPCLYDIANDPCEFNNIADLYPDVVRTLLKRLEEYSTTAVPPGKKPYDPRAAPKLHGYAWTTWMDDIN